MFFKMLTTPPGCSIWSAPGIFTARISNPTTAAPKERAALHPAISTLMGQGGHIVASVSIYGGDLPARRFNKRVKGWL